MNRIDRLFGILTLLQSRKYTRADTVASKFDISIRTVYRDIKALSEQGIPLSFEPNKGYFIVQGYFLQPVSFTSEEANALLIMEALVQGFADKSTQANYSTALNKVKAVLKTSQKEKIEALSNNIRLQVPPCFNINYDYLALVQNAIACRNIIEIEYCNNADISSRRQVEPLGLVFYALNWHLIAWCHFRNEYRDFRLSRIASLRNLDTPYLKTDHIELSEYMKLIPVNY